MEELHLMLKERELQVLILRMGLLDGHPRTQEEVAREFNTDKLTIAQIEAKALRKTRNPGRNKLLKEIVLKMGDEQLIRALLGCGLE